jgi:tetratricopeptide (TPR) repeat protein
VFLDSREIPHWHDNGQLYKKVAQDDPEQAVGFLGLGQYYFNHEDYAAAENNYLLALQKTRDSKSRVDPLLALGTINGINNKLDISAAYFQQAVKIDPENSEGWSGLGNVAWMRGQLDQAIAYYEKALSIRPNNYEAAMNLARAYDKTGQHQRADSIRQKASAVRR